jgi:hypothetical protein
MRRLKFGRLRLGDMTGNHNDFDDPLLSPAGLFALGDPNGLTLCLCSMSDICHVATALPVNSSHCNLERPVDRFNPDPRSHPLWTIHRSAETLTNLIFLIGVAPRDSHDTDLYMELAEKELERLRKMLGQQFGERRN